MENLKQPSEISPDTIWAGMIDMFPMLLGTAPFGIVFGAFALEMGLSPEGAQGLSLFVFAGSSQFVGASLYGQGASLLVVAVTTFFINMRHTLYGASLGPKLSGVKSGQRLIMSFFLTDETFAIVSRFKQVRSRYYWGTALAMYINWQIWTLLGLVFGSYLKGLVSMSLGFVMVPAFIAIIVPQIRSKGSAICGVSALGISQLLTDLPHQIGLIVAATAAIIATLVYEYLTSNSIADIAGSRK